jgi:hypothetical protein
MTDKDAIKEFLEFEPKDLTWAADNIVKAIKLFQDSESDTAVMLRKAEHAQRISESLGTLRVEAGKLITNIQCEIAVIETQILIDGVL